MKSVHQINGLHLLLDSSFIDTYQIMVNAIDEAPVVSIKATENNLAARASRDNVKTPKSAIINRKIKNSDYGFESDTF